MMMTRAVCLPLSVSHPASFSMATKEEVMDEFVDALYPVTEILENKDSQRKAPIRYEGMFSEEEEKERKAMTAHVCWMCGKRFSQRSGLSHHLPTHSELRAFVCPVCSKSFRQRSGLTHHAKTHAAVKSYKCQTCGKTFAQGSGLIHHRSTHSLVKTFICDLCGKRFAQRSGLAHHRHIHFKSEAYPT